MPSELEIQTEHLCYRALEWGQGETVLALHGWLDNAGSFAELAPRLEGYRVIAVDLPGHGLSDQMPLGSWYNFPDHAWHLGRIVDGLNLDQFHLLGHSMGGNIATLYASAFNEQLKSLVSIDAPGPISAQVDGTAKRIRDAIKARAKLNMQHNYYPDLESALQARQNAGELPLSGAEHLSKRGLTQDQHGWYWRSDRRMRMPSIQMFTEPQALEMLSSITVETLFVDAAEGFKWAPLEVIKKRQASVKNARQIAIPGGHHLHLTNPQPVAEAILDFWSGLTG